MIMNKWFWLFIYSCIITFITLSYGIFFIEIPVPILSIKFVLLVSGILHVFLIFPSLTWYIDSIRLQTSNPIPKEEAKRLEKDIRNIMREEMENG